MYFILINKLEKGNSIINKKLIEIRKSIIKFKLIKIFLK